MCFKRKKIKGTSKLIFVTQETKLKETKQKSKNCVKQIGDKSL